MNRSIIALLGVLTAALGAVPAHALAPHGDHRNQRGRHDDQWRRGSHARSETARLARELQLTFQQERRIARVLERDRRNTQRLRERLYERERLHEWLHRAHDPRARRAHAEVERLEHQLRQRKWRTRNQVMSVLTPFQRERLARYERNTRYGRGNGYRRGGSNRRYGTRGRYDGGYGLGAEYGVLEILADVVGVRY